MLHDMKSNAYIQCSSIHLVKFFNCLLLQTEFTLEDGKSFSERMDDIVLERYLAGIIVLEIFKEKEQPKFSGKTRKQIKRRMEKDFFNNVE